MKKLFAVIFSLSLILAPVQDAKANPSAGKFKQILVMATGVVGTTVLLKCKLGAMQPSLYAFMAGSLAQIIGEVALGKEKNASIMGQAADVDAMLGSANGEYQRQTIQSQLNSERSNLKAIQKRRKLFTAVTTVYGISMGLALAEALTAIVVLGKDQGACMPNDGLNFAWTLAISTAYKSGLDGFSVDTAAKVASKPLATKAVEMVKKKLAVNKTTEELIQKTTPPVEKTAIPMLNTGWTRVGVFGGFTLVSGVAMSELKKAENEKKKNIENLEKVLASMPQDPSGIELGISTINDEDPSNNEDPSINDDPSLNGNPLNRDNRLNNNNNNQNTKLARNRLKALSNPSPIRTCLGGSLGDPNMSSDACKNPISIPRTTISGLTPDITILKDGYETGADMAQALAEGDMERADLAASKLGQMAGRVDTIRKDLLKKVNDKLVAEGKKPIDINAEADRQIRAVSDALKDSHPEMGGMNLASLSAGEANVSETISGGGLAPVQALTPPQPATAPQPVTASQPVAAAPTNGTPEGKEVDLFDVGAGEGGEYGEAGVYGEEGEEGEAGEVVDGLAANSTTSLGGSVDQNKTNRNDIQKDSTVSIFKQLSNRYILNYTKIFNRKETPQAEPAPSSP